MSKQAKCTFDGFSFAAFPGQGTTKQRRRWNDSASLGERQVSRMPNLPAAYMRIRSPARPGR